MLENYQKQLKYLIGSTPEVNDRMNFKAFKKQIEFKVHQYITSLKCTKYMFLLSGAIFEQGTDEVQSAFRFAMLNHNQNTTKRNFELQAYVDVINTADAFKLSRLSKWRLTLLFTIPPYTKIYLKSKFNS